MQRARSSTKWLVSGPFINQRCLPLACRGAFHHPLHQGFRQLSVKSPRQDRPDRGENLLKTNVFTAKPQDPTCEGDTFEKVPNSADRSPSRVLIFLLFPFTRNGIATNPLTSRQQIRFRRRVIWLYRILWSLGIGYTVNAYLLPESPSEKHPVFNAPRFTPFTVIGKEDVSPTSFILTLRPHSAVMPGTDPYAASWSQGPWSVEFKQPQLQIARSYTPLPPPCDMQSSSDLRFLIRREKGGEVSNYLAALPLLATVEMRGPHPEVDLPADVTDIVFLAGGTGIAPAMQVAHTLLETRVEGGRPRVHIVWANRKRDDCLGGVCSSGAKSLRKDQTRHSTTGTVVRELQEMRRRYPEYLTVDYLVDEEGTFLDQNMISALTTRAAVENRVGSKLLFVSGPEGFVNFLAGPKIWECGEEKQGELGGVISRMGLKDWKVWKL
jgi:cytochrome-b5 reductase